MTFEEASLVLLIAVARPLRAAVMTLICSADLVRSGSTHHGRCALVPAAGYRPVLRQGDFCSSGQMIR
jgi:hypothetical protein